MSDELARLRADLEAMKRIEGLWTFGHAFSNEFYEQQGKIRDKIARLEAEQADPWRLAQNCIEGWRKSDYNAHVVAFFDHLTAERDRLAARVEELERHVATAVQAGSLYRQASFQSHSGHWDSTMQRGKGCLECIRANDLRKEADEMMDQEKFPDLDDPILGPARVLATANEIIQQKWTGNEFCELLAKRDAAKPYRLKGETE